MNVPRNESECRFELHNSHRFTLISFLIKCFANGEIQLNVFGEAICQQNTNSHQNTCQVNKKKMNGQKKN